MLKCGSFALQILPSYLQLHLGAVRGDDLLVEELGRPEVHQLLRRERPELAGIVVGPIRSRPDPETRRQLDRFRRSDKLLRRGEGQNNFGNFQVLLTFVTCF